jgi:hypothetical protein
VITGGGIRAHRGGYREPVVRIGPHRHLLGIGAGGTHALRELRQLIAAALADGRERRRVSRQRERDLVRLPGLVPAGHGSDGQHRAINAT